MYKEILSRRKNKEGNLQPDISSKFIAYEYSQLLRQLPPQKSISPWESQENSNKNQSPKRQQHFKNPSSHKRSLQLNKIAQIQFYSKTEQRNSYTKISKDFLLLLKKQKHQQQLQNRISPLYGSKKISKIQMSLNGQKYPQIQKTQKRGQSIPQNPELREIHKTLPIKVKIHKKLIEDYHKKVLENEGLSSDSIYKTIRVFPNSKNTWKNQKKNNNETKLRKQKSISNKSENQKKFTLQDFYNLDPIHCKGDIISHQPSKTARKYRFRNNLAIGLHQPDAQTFLYKI